MNKNWKSAMFMVGMVVGMLCFAQSALSETWSTYKGHPTMSTAWSGDYLQITAEHLWRNEDVKWEEAQLGFRNWAIGETSFILNLEEINWDKFQNLRLLYRTPTRSWDIKEVNIVFQSIDQDLYKSEKKVRATNMPWGNIKMTKEAGVFVSPNIFNYLRTCYHPDKYVKVYVISNYWTNKDQGKALTYSQSWLEVR